MTETKADKQCPLFRDTELHGHFTSETQHIHFLAMIALHLFFTHVDIVSKRPLYNERCIGQLLHWSWPLPNQNLDPKTHSKPRIVVFCEWRGSREAKQVPFLARQLSSKYYWFEQCTT